MLSVVLGGAGAWIADAAASDGLPADIETTVRKRFASADAETRYLDGAIDLNADGKPEIVVYVVGGMVCGTGGCPTLIFTPQASGYRLVSELSVTNPPIRASKLSTAGWRNLIVRVSGGGARTSDVELLFDGKSYPGNPTVSGARVKPTTGTASTIVIKEMTSFEEAKPLRASSGTGSSAAGTQPMSGPSFDCAKAASKVEKLVCADSDLAGLDRKLAAAYSKGMTGGEWSEPYKAKEHATQRAWIKQRDACGQQQDVKRCAQSSYQRRLVELQIRGGALTAPTPVEYSCKGHENEPFAVAFYEQTEPRSAAITMGNRQEIAFATQTASGARYTNANVDLWEHHGEATVKWSGSTFTCNAR